MVRAIKGFAWLMKKALLYKFYSWILGPFWGAIATENADQRKKGKNP